MDKVSDMTNEDYKALGLPLYEDMVHAFQETDHYNICHKASEEWIDGAEWVRNIAIDAIKAKEKEMIEKAKIAYCSACATGLANSKICRECPCVELGKFTQLLKEK